ncbi:GH25 family lysozyme [Amedibacillus sp. YH-ame6]
MPIRGIDVSEHNGVINWENMKAQGLSFVIIRSSWGHFVEDKQFRRNVKECDRLRIPYGLYHYSYVSNKEEMKVEADGFIGLCKSCKPLYPCYIDMEDADGWKASLNVRNEMNVETCYYTCDALEQAGFYAGIYANLDWLTNRINSSRLDRFDKWVAQWAITNSYSLPYGMWQYTSDGSIPGHNGRLDMDYAYYDYPVIIKEQGLNGYGTPTVDPTPPTPSPTPKYAVGTPVTYTGLWTQSNGGNWYPKSALAIKEGVITKVIVGAEHPYLINHGTGWANDQVIDDEKSVPGGSGDIVYIVKPGDTLSGIAANYGTTYQALAQYNGIANPSLIYSGQQIRIPR